MKIDRIRRINSLFKTEIAKLFHSEYSIPKGIVVSVTKVDTSPDLEQSKVFVSIYAPDGSEQEIFKILKKGIKHIRFELAKRVEIRKVPRLYYILDESIEIGARVTELIDSIQQNQDEN